MKGTHNNIKHEWRDELRNRRVALKDKVEKEKD